MSKMKPHTEESHYSTELLKKTANKGHPRHWRSFSDKIFDPQKMSSLLLSSMLKKLDASEREFRTLAENAPDYIVRFDTEGRYLYFNPAIERLLGKSLSELYGTFVLDEYQEIKDVVAQVVASGEKITIPLTVQTKEGEVQFHEMISLPERDESGQIVSVLTIGRDLTEQKRTKEALQKALELNEEIINAIPDLLFELDAEGNYLNIWAQDENLLAEQKEILLGKNIREVLPPDAVEVALEMMRDVDATGHTSGHCYCLNLQGGKKWFELSASKKKSSGTYIILSRDITEREE
jgi:PAS domain S-box-containing protein